MSVEQNKTVAIIDLAAVNYSSPAGTQIDVAMKSFHGLTLLEWCARRLSESTTLDQIVITGLPNYFNELQSSSLCGARWIPSLENDPVLRVLNAAERSGATWVVLANPTCPFLDPSLLDRLITSAWNRPEADYVGFIAPKHPRWNLAKLGLVGEICTRRAMEQMKSKKLRHDIDIAQIIRSHPNIFQMRLIPLPEALDRADLHFAMDNSTDWERAQHLIEATGDDLTWQRLVELTDSKLS
jgi:spore coat polysaccharide biosynthesis protein SpsF (cytidylyltransferase family)